jgi:hypothetical protein
MILMLGGTGDVVQDRLLTIEVLVEENLLLECLIVVDSREPAVGFDSRLISVSLTGLNPLLSTL